MPNPRVTRVTKIRRYRISVDALIRNMAAAKSNGPANNSYRYLSLRQIVQIDGIACLRICCSLVWMCEDLDPGIAEATVNSTVDLRGRGGILYDLSIVRTS